MSYAVPMVAGVPALLGGSSILTSGFSLGSIADVAGVLEASLGQMWGIFLNGIPVVTADTVTSMDARGEYVLADYPVESGAFESYDKVQRPFDVRFRFASGGSTANRAALLSSVRRIVGDMNLYTFLSPDDVYQSVSVSHYDYRRTAANGVGLLQVDVWGWQVIVRASSQTTTKSPGSADQSNGGAVSARPASAGTEGAVVNGASLLNPDQVGTKWPVTDVPLGQGGTGHPQ